MHPVEVRLDDASAARTLQKIMHQPWRPYARSVSLRKGEFLYMMRHVSNCPQGNPYNALSYPEPRCLHGLEESLIPAPAGTGVLQKSILTYCGPLRYFPESSKTVQIRRSVSLLIASPKAPKRIAARIAGSSDAVLALIFE